MTFAEAKYQVLKKLGIIPDAWIAVYGSHVIISDCTFLGETGTCVRGKV